MLAEITQNYLSQKSNQYIHSHQSNKIGSSHSKMLKRKSESSPDNSRKKIELSQNSNPISNPPSNIASDNSCDSSSPGAEIVSIDLQERIDDDKLISVENKRESSSLKSAPVVSSLSNIASVMPSSTAASQFSSSAIIDFVFGL